MPTKLMPVPSFNQQRGAGLIEVSVSLFLLAIGLLGILSLQNTSQRSNQSAMYSSQATLYLEDMVNRILASDDPQSTADNGAYNQIDTKNVSSTDEPDCYAGCGAADVVRKDRIAWSNAIKANLPGGRGQVEYVAATDTYTVRVMWDDQLTGATGTNCGGNPKVDLRCLSMRFEL